MLEVTLTAQMKQDLMDKLKLALEQGRDGWKTLSGSQRNKCAIGEKYELDDPGPERVSLQEVQG
jgi:hypothetical protein